ncbi:CoaE-domain-containing protein [Choiromyces venosus 120613-1]|uniref:CoaE-domain-containing protein n=1 Tax=Choiromyces venosus 120613-1 TaxID=1336337 RepID=A0A3N4KD53_9PEZI|nr:CoaE-domain-containing protein [Choiromyces venosus 120613-1]
MLLIGLTGSISTGKSTVSKILSKDHALPIIDADQLARKVVEVGSPGHTSIVKYFSDSTPGLLNDDGTLNRAVLGRRVFGDDAERRKDRGVLNGIVHPLVRKEMYKSIAFHYLSGAWAVVLDIPLLFESSLDLMCGAVLVVSVSSPEVQLSRLLARDAHLTREDAEKRVASQMSIQEKAERCERVFGGARGRGVVISNDGSVEELCLEVGRAVEELKVGRDGWWKWMLWGLPPVAGVVGARVLAENWWWRDSWLREREGIKAKL